MSKAVVASASVASVALTAVSVIGAAGGAHAEVAAPLEPCATYADSLNVDNPDSASGEQFYMPCIPQYGLGKAEFTISSDVDFPADFTPLGDQSVTRTTSFDVAAAAAYYGPDFAGSGALLNQIQRVDDGSNPRVQRYRLGLAAVDPLLIPTATLPISTAGPVELSALPAGCQLPGDPYNRMFAVQYQPFSMSFAETAGGSNWATTVNVAPPTLFIAFSIEPGATQMTTGTPFCFGTMENTTTGTADGSSSVATVLGPVLLLNPYSAQVSQNYLGDFPVAHSLPNTGQNAQVIGIIAGVAGGLIIVGIGIAVLLGIRRRKDSRSPDA